MYREEKGNKAELKQRLIAKKRCIQKVILTEYILARKWEEGD